MDINLQSLVKKDAKESAITVLDEIFNQAYNEALIHQVVTSCLSNQRAGTHAQKTRATVSGGGVKPWRQKGTGRARAGSIRSPLWRHGGVAFAAKPTDYSQKINKKMYRAALRSILSQLLRDERLKVVNDIAITKPKTKELLELLSKLHLSNQILIVTESIDKNLDLASRNVPNITVVDVNMIDPVNLISHEHVLMTKNALIKINEVLK